MLEFLFRGFFEWIYGLIVDIWGFIAGGLLDIMGLDFAYIQSHIPIMNDMARVLMAAGGLCMMIPDHISDVVGLIVVGGVIVFQRMGAKKAALS